MGIPAQQAGGGSVFISRRRSAPRGQHDIWVIHAAATTMVRLQWLREQSGGPSACWPAWGAHQPSCIALQVLDDPTLRNLRSGFGRQVVSPASTVPAWGFGTSHRDAANKVRAQRRAYGCACLLLGEPMMDARASQRHQALSRQKRVQEVRRAVEGCRRPCRPLTSAARTLLPLMHEHAQLYLSAAQAKAMPGNNSQGELRSWHGGRLLFCLIQNVA